MALRISSGVAAKVTPGRPCSLFSLSTDTSATWTGLMLIVTSVCSTGAAWSRSVSSSSSVSSGSSNLDLVRVGDWSITVGSIPGDTPFGELPTACATRPGLSLSASAISSSTRRCSSSSRVAASSPANPPASRSPLDTAATFSVGSPASTAAGFGRRSAHGCLGGIARRAELGHQTRGGLLESPDDVQGLAQLAAAILGFPDHLAALDAGLDLGDVAGRALGLVRGHRLRIGDDGVGGGGLLRDRGRGGERGGEGGDGRGVGREPVEGSGLGGPGHEHAVHLVRVRGGAV